MSHWLDKYIDIPWEPGGCSLAGFDCFGLYYWIQKYEYGISAMPRFQYDPESLFEICSKIEEARKSLWTKLERPKDGCAVLMSTHTKFHHIGTFANIDGGLVVHAADKEKVIAQSLLGLRVKGYRRIEFYEYGSHN